MNGVSEKGGSRCGSEKTVINGGGKVHGSVARTYNHETRTHRSVAKTQRKKGKGSQLTQVKEPDSWSSGVQHYSNVSSWLFNFSDYY